MSWKSTAVLLVITAALLVYFKYYEPKNIGTTDGIKNSQRLVIMDRDELTGMVITNHDLKIDLRRNEAKEWVMKSPIADRADVALISEVMTNLETAQRFDTIPAGEFASNKSKLSDFGLQAPRLHLQLIAKGSEKGAELIFGNDTAVTDKTYVQVAGSNNVFVTNSELKKVIDKEVNAWRDHRLVQMAATDVTKLTVKNSAGEMELQRAGDHWQITKPLNARANEQKVNDLASQLTNMTVGSFVADDKADAANYGLAEPRGVITLYSAAMPKGVEMIVGTPKTAAPTAGNETPAASATPVPAPDGSIYLRIPSRQSIYTVAKGIEDFLNLKPNDVRDRSLAHLNSDTVDRIKIVPAGGESFTVAHKDKAWTVLAPPSGQSANAAAAEKLVEGFNGAQVASFVSDTASDLAKYGLDKPSLKVVFSAFASENTAESGAGERPLATVSFGKVDEPNVFVRVEEEPFILSVPRTVLDAVPADRTQWQPLDLFKADSEKLGSISIGARGQPEVTVARAGKGPWTLTKGKGPLEEGKVQSIANTLSRLHAVRWVAPGSLPTDVGLGSPAFATFRFATPGNAEDSGVLLLGRTSPENMGYARVEGRPGTFLISRPDYDTLLQPLVPEAAVPSPTPVPEPTATVPPASPIPTPAQTVSPTPAPSPTASISTPEATIAPIPTPAAPAEAPAPVPSILPSELPTAVEPVPASTPAASPTPAATASPQDPVAAPESTSVPASTVPVVEPTPAP